MTSTLIGAGLLGLWSLHAVMAQPVVSAAANTIGPPPGHTGGFGEPTCAVCHDGGELNAPGGTLRVEGLPLEFVPGARYPFDVVFESRDSELAGFQAAMRYVGGGASGSTAGQLQAVTPDVSVTIDSATGVEYVQHTRPDETISDARVVRWPIVWIAPATADSVAFHVAANGANGDNSPLDDLIYTAEARLAPGAEPE